MAELPVEKLLISEVLQKISNAKTKKEKVALLKKYKSPALQSILIWAYDESVKSMLHSCSFQLLFFHHKNEQDYQSPVQMKRLKMYLYLFLFVKLLKYLVLLSLEISFQY